MDHSNARRGFFGESLSIQAAVFKALLLREMTSRFGRENIGILWLIGEPMIFATVITLVHMLKGGSNTSGSIQPGMFTLVGYTGYLMFRSIFNRADSIIASSLPLLYHRSISLLDLVLVRTVIELVGCFGAYFVLMIIFIMLDLGDFPARPLYLFAAYGLIAWFSTACGMVIAYIAFGRPTIERMTHMFSYLMLPFSGAFFMISWLPPEYAAIMVWNPLAISFEIMRYGQFETASDEFISFSYVLSANGILTFVGLILLRKLRKRIRYT